MSIDAHDSLRSAASTESYEALQESAASLNREAAAAWDKADKEAENLRSSYRNLEEDTRFSAEYKSEAAWSEFDAKNESIAENRRKARELLAKQADASERLSIPTVDGESLVTNDTQKLLLTQQESSRLIRKLERLSASSSSSPLAPDRVGLLKAEYSKALSTGGIQGGCLVRAVVAAADELGLDIHSIVNDHRKPRHAEMLERSQKAQRLVSLISKKGAPAPSFPRPGALSRGSISGGGRGVFQRAHSQPSSPARPNKRKPLWK